MRIIVNYATLGREPGHESRGAGSRLELGKLPGPEARRLLDDLRRAGLRTELRNRSRVSYLPLDRTTGTALLVEDEAEAQRLVQDMIRAGVPVKRVAE